VLRSCLVAVVALLCLAPAASAAVNIPGLSQGDGNAIIAMANAHWPETPCPGRLSVTLVASGPKVRTGAGCSLILNARAGLNATGWCHALKPALAKLAAGTKPSAVPYRCALVVGPVAKQASYVAMPGLSREQALPAFEVASKHWPHSSCAGREQIIPVPEAALTGVSIDRPTGGTVILGMARLHDPRCIVFLTTAVPWTQTTLCITAEHEFGHLLGLKHSTDPGSVMSPVNSRSTDCEDAFGPLPPELGGDLPTPVGTPTGFGGITPG
jgi:hypothetical protein